MTPDWLQALNDFMGLRDEEAQIEKQDDCGCDYENFYICDNCKERKHLAEEQRRLLNRWGDTWAVQLVNRVEKEKQYA